MLNSHSDEPYVITPGAPTAQYKFTVLAPTPAWAVHRLCDRRLLKEIFGALPIISLELRPNAVKCNALVAVRLASNDVFSFELNLRAYYANCSMNGDMKVPLRYLAEKVIEEYYARFPVPEKETQRLKDTALPPPEDLLVDP